jgi:hypothetical protein
MSLQQLVPVSPQQPLAHIPPLANVFGELLVLTLLPVLKRPLQQLALALPAFGPLPVKPKLVQISLSLINVLL